jgi:hypothetical protein
LGQEDSRSSNWLGLGFGTDWGRREQLRGKEKELRTCRKAPKSVGEPESERALAASRRYSAGAGRRRRGPKRKGKGVAAGWRAGSCKASAVAVWEKGRSSAHRFGASRERKEERALAGCRQRWRTQSNSVRKETSGVVDRRAGRGGGSREGRDRGGRTAGGGGWG